MDDDADSSAGEEPDHDLDAGHIDLEEPDDDHDGMSTALRSRGGEGGSFFFFLGIFFFSSAEVLLFLRGREGW